jgi:glycosyltransferase involved in cell wall biosynthesis
LEAKDMALSQAKPIDQSGWPAGDDRASVLVTIPVHNEVSRLLGTLEALDGAFRPTGLDYSLSIAEDGSTDGTKDLLRELPETWPGLLIQEAADSLGRGRALRQLWSTTPADVYCFTDADLAAGPEVLVTAVRRVVNGAPIVVGSRYAPGACTIRPPVRSFVAQAYNKLLRFSFGETLHDHQCGLKAFNSEVIRELLPRTQEDSWFWDTEILILALKAGFPVLELPTTWIEKKRSRTQFRRLLSDLVIHGTALMRLRSRVRAGGTAIGPIVHGIPAPPPGTFTYHRPSNSLRR